MTGVSGAGLVPITVHFRDSQIPDLILHEGEVGTRGYQARFISSNGEVINPSERQTVTCYARNIDTKESYYLKGSAIDDYWVVEVPSKALAGGGEVDIQLALKEDDKNLIMTNWSRVRVQNFIGGEDSKDGTGILMDFQKLHEQAESAKAALDAVTQKAQEAKDYADRGNRDLATLEAGEAGRVEAEKKRASDYQAFSTEGKKTVDSLKAQDDHYRQEIGDIESQEAERVQAEEARKSQEASRVSAESARTTQEGKRSSEEAKRVQAERARAKVESLRTSQEAERVRAERFRESSEGSRLSQEADRQESERARESQEASRVEAEKDRKTTFEGWDKTMQGILPDGTSDRAGVVKVSGTSGETAPYTVPSMGALADGLAKAGKVKSVNGKTGDVVIPEYDDSTLKSRVTALEQREDKDTTYPLATTSQDGLLSAGDKAQLDGLSGALEAKADKGHIHDDRYYTEAEVDEKLGGKADTGHTHAQYQTKDQVQELIGYKFVLCTSLDDAKSQQSSGSYPVGTVFLIKKEG